VPLPTPHSRATFGALKASIDPLPDHDALKLGESTADLKHELLAALQRLAVASGRQFKSAQSCGV
jgi:hypothetical protein